MLRAAGPSQWKLDDPVVMRKELAEKKEKAAEAAEKKRQNKIAQLKKDLAKWEGFAIPDEQSVAAAQLRPVTTDTSDTCSRLLQHPFVAGEARRGMPHVWPCLARKRGGTGRCWHSD